MTDADNTWDRFEEMPQQLVGYDAGKHINIDSTESAERVFQTVVDYFWADAGVPTGKLPAGRDVSLDEADFQGLDMSDVARAERLDAVVEFGWSTHLYLFHPKRPRRRARLVVVHHGHAQPTECWTHGIGMTAEWLLRQGCHVLGMQMPMRGWHFGPTTIDFPSGSRTVGTHDEFVERLEIVRPGLGIRFFIEPVVQAINHGLMRLGLDADVAMVGLSGGGWTTHVVAAVDRRIRVSIPVAGSHPMYVRECYDYPYDLEQSLPELYEERATWMDLYALGAIGGSAPRRQVQLLNQYDSCCFYGVAHKTYEPHVRRAVAAAGSGQWDVVLDRTHREHQISPHALETTIAPALEL